MKSHQKYVLTKTGQILLFQNKWEYIKRGIKDGWIQYCHAKFSCSGIQKEQRKDHISRGPADRNLQQRNETITKTPRDKRRQRHCCSQLCSTANCQLWAAILLYQGKKKLLHALLLKVLAVRANAKPGAGKPRCCSPLLHSHREPYSATRSHAASESQSGPHVPCILQLWEFWGMSTGAVLVNSTWSGDSP